MKKITFWQWKWTPFFTALKSEDKTIPNIPICSLSCNSGSVTCCFCLQRKIVPSECQIVYIKFNVICKTPLDLRLINFSCYLIYSMTMNSHCLVRHFSFSSFKESWIIYGINWEKSSERQTMAIRRKMVEKKQCARAKCNVKMKSQIEIRLSQLILAVMVLLFRKSL